MKKETLIVKPTEQQKLNSLINDLLGKILHPDLFSQIETQIGRAMSEQREEILLEASGKEYQELIPLLKQLSWLPDHPSMRKLRMEAIIKKINELF